MSLKTRKTLVPVMCLSLIALVAASCASEQRSPTSPSGLSQLAGINNVVTEYWVTIADETPAPVPGPAPEPGAEPVPAPAPGPAPAPAPAPGTPGPGGNMGTWPPGPPPAGAPGAPIPSPPNSYWRLTLKIPDPVLHDGKPIDLAGCRSNPYTWYYDQLLHNETDVTVELMERENFFDGRFTSRNTERINIGKYDTVILHTRWCSGVPTFHYAQTRFKGRDNTGEQVVLNGPWVRLFAPGTR